MAKRTKLLIGSSLVLGCLCVSLLISAHSSRGAPLAELGDTPWPMYQHDARHSGQSPYLLPQQQPELIWSVDRLRSDSAINCGNGGITVNQAGRLVISLCGEVRNFDPISRQTIWIAHPGPSTSTPLIDSGGSMYIGGGITFNQISPTGSIIWTGLLDNNYAFNSSAVFGVDGNIYFVHDGLWSVTPDGQLRWYIPYGTVYGYSHASPAAGENGVIYAGGNGAHLCAYLSDGSSVWCYSNELGMEDRTPAIASDGSIYTSVHCELYAVNPTGTLKWAFSTDEASTDLCNIGRGMAVGNDDSVYFYVYGEDILPLIYAVDADGHFKWKMVLPTNLTSGLVASSPTPIVLDRAGNLFFCTANSYCYAISPQGSILWENEFPLVDSIVRAGGLQPLLAADGLLFIVDNQTRLYAFADPGQYPQLTSPTHDLYFDAEPGTLANTATVSVSSTISPITYTVAYTPTGWLSVSPITGTTPSEFVVSLDPSSLPVGNYRSQLTIKPSAQPGKWLTIPVGLSVGLSRAYAPMVFSDYQIPGRILYRSAWFSRIQLAAIDQDGRNRTALNTNMPADFVSMVYSPDGKKVAFQYNNPENKWRIHILDVETGGQLLDIESNGWNTWPTWSPDSSQVMFVSTRDDPNGEIYRIDIDGTHLTRLTFNNLSETSYLQWSPMGNLVAVTVNYNRTYLMNPDGTNLHNISPGTSSNFPLAWSPDGRYLAVKNTTDGRTYYLWLFDSQTGSYSNLGVPLNLDSAIAWSPDGQQIAYEYTTRYYETNDIYIIDADGGNQLRILHDGYEDAEPSWSPDGIWLAFAGRKNEGNENPNWDIFVVRRDGAKFSQITQNLKGDTIPYWQDR